LPAVLLLNAVPPSYAAERADTAESDALAPHSELANPTGGTSRVLQTSLLAARGVTSALTSTAAPAIRAGGGALTRAGLVASIRGLLSDGRVRNAFDQVKAFLQADPEDEALLCLMGDIQFRRAEFDAAEETYAAVLRKNPQSARAHWGLGRVSRLRFQRQTARDHFSRAYTIDPADPDIVMDYASIMPDQEARKSLLYRLVWLTKSTDLQRAGDALARVRMEEQIGPQPLARLAGAYRPYRLGLRDYFPATAQPSGVMISARVDGGKPLRLVLDTGASGIVLNHKAAEGLAAQALAESEVGGLGNGSARAAWIGLVKRVSFSTISTSAISTSASATSATSATNGGASPSSSMMNSGASPSLSTMNSGTSRSLSTMNSGTSPSLAAQDLELENVPLEILSGQGIPAADGVIGSNVFNQFVIRLDARSHVLELLPFEAPDPAPRPADRWASRQAPLHPVAEFHKAEPMHFSHAEGSQDACAGCTACTVACEDHLEPAYAISHFLVLKAEMEGRSGYFLLDTGSTRSVISQVLLQQPGMHPLQGAITLLGAQGELQASRGSSITWTLAGNEWRERESLAADLTAMSNRQGVEISGTIGYSLIAHSILTINYRDGLVGLRPR
jgi:tetratricopeptide (TPR) repeat protein